MSDLVKSFKDTVIIYLSSESSIDEFKIDEIIEQMSQFGNYKDKITKEDKELVRKQIHAEYSITLDSGTALALPYKYEKWFLNMKKDIDLKYWDRYKEYLIKDKKFPRQVVNKMDDISDELTDLLGKPNVDEMFQRKGLVLGDVQSGKTSNYNALICKAIDAGYKAIVLLTGTTNKLRTQTQKRVDEAILGFDSNALSNGKNEIIGAGKYNQLNIGTFTSKANDFNTSIADSLNIDLNFSPNPYVFVIKKNTSTLKNLNKWFKQKNCKEDKIKNSLLLIDDEADSASINTKGDKEEPTRINALIREMLSMFEKASYVGFTATPFANIFIDPETDEDMKNEDLFPKDYIYSLESPSNYIGAEALFSEESKYGNTVRIIEDIEGILPIKHKKEDNIDKLPNSLKEAINVFFLANVIRDLRKDNDSHRSMMINISRFIAIQEKIHVIADNYVKEIQDAINVFSKLEEERALKNEYIKNLYEVYLKEYSNLEYSWEEIQDNLKSSTVSIKVFKENSNSKELNYEEYEKNGGLRAIVIGGFTLSRGLTLEGLIVSYFYRNSKMYDTLMQMGRWFGYRNNYDDLCRIYIDENNINSYDYIYNAINELKTELIRMKELGKTPLDFGLKVRNDKDSLLIITARNKMRTSSTIKKLISLSGEIVETPYIYSSIETNEKNYQNIQKLVNNIKNNQIIDKNGYKDVEKSNIISLLNNIETPVANIHFNSKELAQFINNYKGQELDNWDVFFIGGNSENRIDINGKEIKFIERQYNVENNIVHLNKSRLGGAEDMTNGIEKSDILKAREEFAKLRPNKKPSGKAYLTIKRNPLLLIYFVEKNQTIEDEEYLVAFSIGIPKLTNEETKYKEYQVNKVYKNSGIFEIEDEYGDDE